MFHLMLCLGLPGTCHGLDSHPNTLQSGSGTNVQNLECHLNRGSRALFFRFTSICIYTLNNSSNNKNREILRCWGQPHLCGFQDQGRKYIRKAWTILGQNTAEKPSTVGREIPRTGNQVMRICQLPMDNVSIKLKQCWSERP